MADVSLQVLGALGGATRQAVSKSGDPLRWLQARVRRALVPSDEHHWSHRVGCIPKRARGHAEQLLEDARVALDELPEPGTGGRPSKRDPEGLALVLGVRVRRGDTLHMVFARWVSRCLKDLVLYYRRLPKGEHWYKMRGRLDLWLPRWANRRTGRAPASWVLAREALSEQSW